MKTICDHARVCGAHCTGQEERERREWSALSFGCDYLSQKMGKKVMVRYIEVHPVNVKEEL